MSTQTQRVVDEEQEWDEDEDAQKDMFMTFHLDGEDYGIEIFHVVEIVGMQKITDVPEMAEFVRGVINLRGQVIPVLDMRVRFQMMKRDYDDRTCIIVVNVNETVVGLIVDTVSEVQNIPADQISPPPKIAKGPKSRYMLGLGKINEKVVILLDVNKLLFSEVLEAVEKINQKEPKESKKTAPAIKL